jgi:hypothetical protein
MLPMLPKIPFVAKNTFVHSAVWSLDLAPVVSCRLTRAKENPAEAGLI